MLFEGFLTLDGGEGRLVDGGGGGCLVGHADGGGVMFGRGSCGSCWVVYCGECFEWGFGSYHELDCFKSVGQQTRGL